MPDWLNVILLGIIEGITEFIPISSTGHLLIAERWLTRQSDLFNVVIQSGAVLAVIPLFRARFEQFFHRWREPATRDLLLKIVAAFAITSVTVLAFEKRLKLPEELIPVGWALLVGGIVFLLVELLTSDAKRNEEITWSIAVAVGLAQFVAAIFPGASRSGTTIMLALLLGLRRSRATEFSFLVGIPTMIAAGGYKVLKEVRHPHAVPENWGMVLLGTVVAAAVSFVAVKWLLRYVQTHSFTGFGIYRIVLGLLILAWLH